MDIRKGIDDAKRSINDTVDNVKDASHETMHRSNAQAEHTKRDVAGDSLTAGDKIRSGANEVKENLQADYDKGKQDVRNNT